MVRRLLLGIGPACVLVVCSCVNPVPTVPEFVQAPGHTYRFAESEFRLTASCARGDSLRCIVSWGDDSSEASEVFAQGDTLSMFHDWEEPGHFWVRAMAQVSDDPGLSSEWSESQGIEVLSDDSFPYPLVGVVRPISGTEVLFWVTAVGGRESDSFSFQFDFGDGLGDWTEYVASRETAYISHSIAESIPAVRLKCRVRDQYGTTGHFGWYNIDLDRPGLMLWWWVTQNEDSAAPVTAPVVVEFPADELELGYVGCDDEFNEIYSIDVETGKKREDGHGVLPDQDYNWTTHPAYNRATGYILIAKDEGEFYAFKPTLSYEWHWPGKVMSEELTFTRWGNMCIAGSNIYIPNTDTLNVTRFYKIPDGPERPVDPQFVELGIQRVPGAPVADASGNVFFVTDSGYLYKLDSDLVEQWREQPGNSRRLYGPVVGPAGAIICGDADGMVCAVNPDDGLLLWTTMLPDVGKMYIVVGRTAVYAAAENGHLYALDRGTGSRLWDKAVTETASIQTYPVLTRNGYIYVQDDDDVLYCLEQSDGEKKWGIDCRSYYPSARGRCRDLDDPHPPLTLTSTGNILVVGADALYCVSGDGTLDTEAPWPKWQRDLHNTGCAGSW